QWGASRREVLTEIGRLFGVIELPPPCPPHSDGLSVWMYVAGLTSVADWIGSNVEFFPAVGNEGLQTNPFDIDNYFVKANCQAHEALKRLGWLDRSETITQASFAELF